MAKQGWAAKLKQELADTKAELEALKDAAVADVKDDTKSIGFGDVAFFIGGAIVGGLLVWIF